MQSITYCKVLVASLMLLATTQSYATLTSYTANGKEVVYSSVSDVTWTKDANLLGSMFASQGVDTVVSAIIAASSTISNTPNAYSPTGTYTVTASDFYSDGRTSWFGAMSYVNFLNGISYGGSNQWYLPTRANTTWGWNTHTNGTAKGDEQAELYYQELGSVSPYDRNNNYQPNFGIKDPSNNFDNEQPRYYWSGTEVAIYPDDAWLFVNYDGSHYDEPKNTRGLVWVVSPGQIATVPEPESIAMLLAGLSVVGGVMRRRRC